MSFIDRHWPHGQHVEAANTTHEAVVIGALWWIELKLVEIDAKLDTLTRLEKHMAGELDALKTAVADIKEAVGVAITALDDLAAKLAAIGANDPAAIAAAAADVEALATALKAAVATDDPPATP